MAWSKIKIATAFTDFHCYFADDKEEEELYESIYEIIQPPANYESESDFDEIPEDVDNAGAKVRLFFKICFELSGNAVTS